MPDSWMALASRTRWTLCRYWADRLGVTPRAFKAPGVTIGPTKEGGIQVFSCEDSLIIGTPRGLLDSVQDRRAGLASLDIDDEEEVHGWFTQFDAIEQIVGPTFYGYADRETFTPAESDARILTTSDKTAYQTFRNGIPDAEWDQGGTEFNPGETVGRFVDDDLVAVGGFDVWDGLLAQLSVLTHPDHRGHGHGQAVVSRVTEKVFTDGLLPQYRTSDAWPWSVALAKNLGFHRFSTAYFGSYQP